MSLSVALDRTGCTVVDQAVADQAAADQAAAERTWGLADRSIASFGRAGEPSFQRRAHSGHPSSLNFGIV